MVFTGILYNELSEQVTTIHDYNIVQTINIKYRLLRMALNHLILQFLLQHFIMIIVIVTMIIVVLVIMLS